MNELIRSAVAVKDGKVVTTSLKIAEVFGKQHKDVLKAIRNLECPEDFSQRNFALTSISVPQPNGGTREIPMYEITRDGFTLLVMGFTGDKAMEFKIAYIEAFNQMEAALKQNSVTAEAIVAALTPVIRENERLAARLDFAKHFIPCGQPGELNENGQPKTQWRRGYYTAGKGRSIMALIESPNLPGMFEEIHLEKLR